MKRLLTTLVLFALVLPVLATDYFVDPAAPPGGDGSAPFPFNTIAEALAMVTSGDSVMCAFGDYYEGIALYGPAHDGVTVMGDGMGASRLHGAVTFNDVAGAAVMGFTIYNDVTMDAGSPTLVDCEVTSGQGVSLLNGTTGVVSGCNILQNAVGITCDSSAGTIDSCEIYENSASGILHTGSDTSQSAGNDIHENGTDGIRAEDSSTPSSNGNIIDDNASNGIHVEGSANLTSDSDICENNSQNGFYMEGSSQATITSLTSESNTLNGLYIEGSAYAGTISNSTIQQNTMTGIWIYSSATASMTINNNTVSQNNQCGVQFGAPMKAHRISMPAASLAAGSSPASLSNLNDGGYEPLALTLVFTNNTINQNAVSGIVFNANHTYKVENCTVQNNDLGVVVDSGVNPDCGGGAQSSTGSNDFSDNTTRDFVNNSASNVYAKLCDWTASAEAEMSGEHPDTVDVTLIDDHWENSSWGYVMWDDFGGSAVEETTWGQIKNQF